MKRFIPLLLTLTWAMPAWATLKTETIEYKQGDAVLEGYLAYDDSVSGKRPGILVIHDWTGYGPYVRKRAEQLAGLGYVAFAADIYGKGVHSTDPKEAGRLASIYKSDRKLARARAAAALEVLSKNPNVDASRIAAIGYCFGGMVALELARSGADLAGTVSFHGGLNTPTPEDAKNIKGKVLVLHGADDPYVNEAEVKAFAQEMNAAKIDWQFNAYSGAVHAFTIPEAGNDNSKGAAYNAKADRRSWEAMKVFFNEIFSK